MTGVTTVSEPTLGQTLDFVRQLFDGVTDRQGVPYWRHCFQVMAFTDSQDIEVLHAALLHDVLEDTEVTDLELYIEGYSSRCRELVDLLTRREGQTYREYLDRLGTDRDALLIKDADNRHNTDMTRWPDMPAGMIKRYAVAKRFIDQRLEALS